MTKANKRKHPHGGSHENIKTFLQNQQFVFENFFYGDYECPKMLINYLFCYHLVI